jgi:hypothetical protein
MWIRRAAMPLFLVLVWFTSSFFLLGDLGQWSDDYAYTYRDPVTGLSSFSVHNLFLPLFWRPLYYFIVPPLETWLGGHWTQHLIGAGAHGLVCAGLYSLGRKLGLSRLGASIAFMVLCAFPAAWEAPLWLAALPTVLAAGGLVLLFHIGLWQAKGRLASWPAVWILVIAFAIPCLNEQAAAAVGAVALMRYRVHGKRSVGSALLAGAWPYRPSAYTWHYSGSPLPRARVAPRGP